MAQETLQGELASLLESMFSVDELQQFLAKRPETSELAQRVGFENSLAAVCADVAAGLVSRGVDDDDFFDALRSERPNRSAEISAVESHSDAPGREVARNPYVTADAEVAFVYSEVVPFPLATTYRGLRDNIPELMAGLARYADTRRLYTIEQGGRLMTGVGWRAAHRGRGAIASVTAAVQATMLDSLTHFTSHFTFDDSRTAAWWITEGPLFSYRCSMTLSAASEGTTIRCEGMIGLYAGRALAPPFDRMARGYAVGLARADAEDSPIALAELFSALAASLARPPKDR